MSNCCWTTTTTTTTIKKKRGGSILTLENVHIQKGIILSGCSLSSCMHRMVNIGRGHALNHMSGSAQTSTASKHHWKWFSMLEIFFYFFSSLFLFLFYFESKSTGNGRESGAYFFFLFSPLLLLSLSLPPYLTHRGNMQSRETSRESKKSLIHPSSTYTIADVFNREGTGGITKL